jgi:L-rhamnose isomerase
MAASGFTLSSRDEPVRRYWIDHVRRCREIAAWIGEQLGGSCLHNLWIPDGAKDLTVSRLRHREILCASLDEIFAEEFPRAHLKDSVESKLFGIGTEAYVVGSHDFYVAWAAKHGKVLCLDMGHYHPTESVADKISALLLFVDELLFHVSRAVRWDSDHVVIWNDELSALMEEVVRAKALARVHFALDFFDASLNRVGAWVIGARATLKALLRALLEPTARLRECEERGDNFARLALLEELKALPFGAVWDEYCARMNVPPGGAWIAAVQDYEARVQSRR